MFANIIYLTLTALSLACPPPSLTSLVLRTPLLWKPSIRRLERTPREAGENREGHRKQQHQGLTTDSQRVQMRSGSGEGEADAQHPRDAGCRCCSGRESTIKLNDILELIQCSSSLVLF